MRHAHVTLGLSQRGRLGFARVRPADHHDRTDTAGTFGRRPPILKTLRRWFDLRRQRRALDLLDDRLLKDIGLNRIDVRHEIDKPFWQI